LCAPNEGAAAVVLSAGPTPVRVAAAALRSHHAGSVLGEPTPLSGLADDGVPTPTEMAAADAYAEAGLGPGDLHLVELQDTDAARRSLRPANTAPSVPRPTQPARQTPRRVSPGRRRVRCAAPQTAQGLTFAAPALPAAARPSHDPPTPHARFRIRPETRSRVALRRRHAAEFDAVAVAQALRGKRVGAHDQSLAPRGHIQVGTPAAQLARSRGRQRQAAEDVEQGLTRGRRSGLRGGRAPEPEARHRARRAAEARIVAAHAGPEVEATGARRRVE